MRSSKPPWARSRGGPTGRPLADDDELVGEWTFGDSGTLQWVHVATGGTAVTAVTRAQTYALGADQTFTSSTTGGAGRAGQMKFATEHDEGTWALERDVLVLEGERTKRRYLVVGATRGPDGRRVLLLQPEPFSLGPGAEFEVYVSP